MKSYYYEGAGLADFLEKTEEVRGVVLYNLKLEYGCCFPEDALCYLRLIDHVRDLSGRIFESEPEMLFQIHLSKNPRALFMRIKNIQKEIVTILTVYFSPSAARTKKHCEESFRWSADAFRYVLKEE